MMGPLAGVGDPVFWFTVRPMLGALGASLALAGNILGPIIFFVAWNIIRWAFMWYTQEFGYRAGSKITDDLSGGLLQDVTKGASILGMFVLGHSFSVGYRSHLRQLSQAYRLMKVLMSIGRTCLLALLVCNKPSNKLLKAVR